MNLKNSLYKVSPLQSFDKEIAIPSSKSHSNRALILGAIRGGNFKVHNISPSTDVTHLISALQSIGLQLKIEGSSITFLNSFPECEKATSGHVIELHTGDGGTTNRFLIALLSRGKKEYHLYPTEKMSERPIEDLIRPLRTLNVSITQDSSGDAKTPWIKLQGPATMYNTSKLEIDCEKSTQFASALMLAFSNLPLQFSFLNLHASEAYLRMTEQVMKQSLSANNYTVPVDFSSLSYPIALASLMGRVSITNCIEIDHFQADSIFIEILKSSGALCTLSKEGLEIKKDKTPRAFSFDISKAPDLFPTLVFFAAHIDGVTTLSNLAILKFKESDRVMEMIELMKKFDVDYTYDSHANTLTISGNSTKKYQEAVVHPARDHRIVMAAALFMMKNSGGELFESDCVEKSFPSFFSKLE